MIVNNGGLTSSCFMPRISFPEVLDKVQLPNTKREVLVKF